MKKSAYLFRRTLKPEYVDNIVLDEETTIKHKVWCVWKLLGANCSMAELKRYCTLYGITIEEALNYQQTTPSGFKISK